MPVKSVYRAPTAATPPYGSIHHNLTQKAPQMDLTDREKWEEFLKGLKSADRYDRTVQKYLASATEMGLVWDDPRTMDRYLDAAHDRYLTDPRKDS